MSTELATIPPSTAELDSYMRQAELLSQSALVPAKFRGKPADVLVAALQGRELGWGVTTAMTYIDVIQGVPTISAKGKTALILARGHSIEEVESSDARAVVKGTRGDTGRTMTVSYSIEEARKAGLANKDNWKKHTADMLWARAVSRLCRRFFEDVLGGASYDPTEIDEERTPATVTPINPELEASVARHPSSQLTATGEAIDTETGEIVDVVEPAKPWAGPSGDDPDEEAHKKRMAALHASLHEAWAIPKDFPDRRETEAAAKDALLASYHVESASDLDPQTVSRIIDACKQNPAKVREVCGLPSDWQAYEPEPAA
jgi:hypothetical protein